jgi:hypothetical protein
MTEKKYTVELLSDGDDVILPFPDDLIKNLGWKEGDTLVFKDLGEGTFSITKSDDTQSEAIVTPINN